MIRKQSDDPDLQATAERAAEIVQQVLSGLSRAEAFDYGGHVLKLDDYDMCSQCTGPIAEAQQAGRQLLARAEKEADPGVKEHLELAAQLFNAEAEAAKIRAEFHNGQGSEQIVNAILGFIHERGIQDTYDHSHNGGK
jgi:hypothetical protein